MFALAGLDKPNIGLLSDEFLEEVRELPQRNLAVELLEKLLNDGIHARTKNNVVQEKKYSDRLKAVLLKYNNRAIETAQVIEELIQMAKEFQEAMARDEALGLTRTKSRSTMRWQKTKVRYGSWVMTSLRNWLSKSR